MMRFCSLGTKLLCTIQTWSLILIVIIKRTALNGLDLIPAGLFKAMYIMFSWCDVELDDHQWPFQTPQIRTRRNVQFQKNLASAILTNMISLCTWPTDLVTSVELCSWPSLSTYLLGMEEYTYTAVLVIGSVHCRQPFDNCKIFHKSQNLGFFAIPRTIYSKAICIKPCFCSCLTCRLDVLPHDIERLIFETTVELEPAAALRLVLVDKEARRWWVIRSLYLLKPMFAGLTKFCIRPWSYPASNNARPSQTLWQMRNDSSFFAIRVKTLYLPQIQGLDLEDVATIVEDCNGLVCLTIATLSMSRGESEPCLKLTDAIQSADLRLRELFATELLSNPFHDCTQPI